MKIQALLPLLALLCGGAGTASVQAANIDYFLKIPGIEGESTAKGFENTIEALSWSFGVNHATDGSEPRLELTHLRVETRAGKASPVLMQFCATGQHIDSATILVRRNDEEQSYYSITMSDVLVSSYQSSGSAGGDDVPTEEVAFYYNRVVVLHVGEDGTETVGEASRPLSPSL